LRLLSRGGSAEEVCVGPQMEYTDLTLAELANVMVRTETAIRWCREILDGLQNRKPWVCRRWLKRYAIYCQSSKKI
jgi:hypothetical protein